MASQLRMNKVTLMKTFDFGLYKELGLEKAVLSLATRSPDPVQEQCCFQPSSGQ